jgi:soluble lytic murein transglycosylase-like protein
MLHLLEVGLRSPSLFKHSLVNARRLMPAWPCWLIACVGLWAPVFARAHCFDLAAQRYGVPMVLLQAIAQQESGGRAMAINVNRNGSRDIGLMQINSGWLNTLARHGISERDLFDPCVSALVGAWILANNFTRLGYTTQGLGAYNAVSPDKRERYAAQVLRRVERMGVAPQHTAPQPPPIWAHHP